MTESYKPAKRVPGSTILKGRSPWLWIPSLYFAEGMPYVIVMLVSVVFYKRMGLSNTDIALYTSWLYLPWVIKPLWSPLVDILRTKRFWIIFTQLIIGAGLGGVALSIPATNWFKFTLGFFWLLAFSSATHDIAADGFYMLGLSRHKQTWFVGIRSTFYRLAMITGQGLLIMFAGTMESRTGLPSIDIHVRAISNTDSYFSQTLDTRTRIEKPGELRLICEPSVLDIVISERSQSDIDSIRTLIQVWNEEGFINTHSAVGNVIDSPMESVSWWDRFVTFPLEESFSTYFGNPCIQEMDRAGNVGILSLTLSKDPGPDHEIEVNFTHLKGDKSLKLIEGTRFVFNSNNWNRPVQALIQVDPKLTRNTETIFQARAGNVPLAWILTFSIVALLFILFFIYHQFILPRPVQDQTHVIKTTRQFLTNFSNTFTQFFKKEKIGITIAFILIYRFGEAQLVKIAPLFMLDAAEVCGLSLTTGQYGFVYGTLGMIMLTLGGILGGIVASRQGLKLWILWMALAMKLPDIVYVYLAYVMPDNYFIISLCVAIEQFGYGFGFTAYMLFMITVSEGEHKTAHYAICTGFMALGMMIPGMFSGWLQEIIGYQHFFIWVLICTIPGLLLIRYLPIDPEFGKLQENEM